MTTMIDKGVAVQHYYSCWTGNVLRYETPISMVHERHTASLMATEGMYGQHWLAESENVARAWLRDPMWAIPYVEGSNDGIAGDLITPAEMQEARGRVTMRRRARHVKVRGWLTRTDQRQRDTDRLIGRAS